MAVIAVQLLLCIGRTALWDLPGVVPDGLGIILGLTLLQDVTTVLVLAYGAACTCGFLYNLKRSVDLLLHWRLVFSLHGTAFAHLMRAVALIAPIASLTGIVLAVRLYCQVWRSEPGELRQLMNHSSGQPMWPAQKTRPMQRSQQAQCSSDSSKKDPQQPTRRRERSPPGGRNRSLPFQAIFQASVPRSPRTLPSSLRREPYWSPEGSGNPGPRQLPPECIRAVL